MLLYSEIRVTQSKLILHVFCKFPLQFTTNMSGVYLKLKCKYPDGIILLMAAFPFNNRVKKGTGVVIFSL